jgi:membrane protein YdbS with pleckstrin-like domain
MQFPVKPSLRFAVSLLMLHAIAATVVYATDIVWTARLAMLLLVALNLVYYLLRDDLLLLPYSWREISLDQGDISVAVRNGSSFVGQVTNPYFVVLCVKLEGHCLLASRVILPDSMGEGAFRELCVHLRFL